MARKVRKPISTPDFLHVYVTGVGEGKTVAEIAEGLGVPRAYVHTRVAALNKQFRKHGKELQRAKRADIGRHRLDFATLEKIASPILVDIPEDAES